MEQKLEEVKKENTEQVDEYFAFIKESVNDGRYFKDALDWYFFRYVTPVCDRMLLIFGAILASVVLYCLYIMIDSAFPLVEKDPIFIEAMDQSRYFPNLVELKPKEGRFGYDPEVKNVDEAVLKYLLTVYIKNRESFDFSKAEILEVNEKFNRIKNTSSAEQYRNFQLVMSKDNPDSPIQNFGQNVKKTVEIESVKFLRQKEEGIASKAISYLSTQLPNEAEVRFKAVTKTTSEDLVTKEEVVRYVVKMKFVFGGVKKDAKGGSEIKFIVNGYQLFKVK